MHEITLLHQRALELIDQQAAKHGAKTRNWGLAQKIGAFSCVETSSLAFCFDLVCRGSVAEGCKLHPEEQKRPNAGVKTLPTVCDATDPAASAAVHCVMVTCYRFGRATVCTDSADRNRPGVSDVYNMRLR